MKKTLWFRSSESGQVMVLVMFLLVALIAAVGLAVDGGRLYSARRSAQNAADNAALAGALAICSQEEMNEDEVVSAAEATAGQNGYSNADPGVSVSVDYPPESGLHEGDEDFVEVIINKQEEPGLIQVVYAGAFETSAHAVARCTQTSPAPLGQGNGLIVLHPTASGALNGTGTQATLSVIGGIYVNSNHATGMTAGNIDISASDGIAIVGNYSVGPTGSVSPAPVTGAVPIIDPLLTLADPSRPAGDCINQTAGGTIDPGVYCKIDLTGNKTLVMNAGLYYIEGGVFSISGGSDVSGSGVFIYSTAGAITMSGGGSFNLVAPDSGEYEGLLLFTSRTNTSDITITGGATSTFQGTIYSPAGRLVLSGSVDDLSLDAQVIVNKLQVSGSSSVNVEYDSSLGYNPGTGSKYIDLSE